MSNNVINIIKFSKVKDYNMFVKKYLNNDEMDLNLVAKLPEEYERLKVPMGYITDSLKVYMTSENPDLNILPKKGEPMNKKEYDRLERLIQESLCMMGEDVCFNNKDSMMEYLDSKYDEDSKEMVEQMYVYGKISAEMLVKYGATDVTHWKLLNWGTLSNTFGTIDSKERRIVKFESKLYAPIGVVNRIVEGDKMDAEYTYTDEGRSFAGRIVYVKGEQVSDERLADEDDKLEGICKQIWDVEEELESESSREK